jgi:hypothetical protein
MSQSVYLPTATSFDVLETPRNRVESVAGHSFAVLDNGWACMGELSRQLEEQLIAAGATSVHHFRTPTGRPCESDYLDEIAAKVAGAITGLGN